MRARRWWLAGLCGVCLAARSEPLILAEPTVVAQAGLAGGAVGPVGAT
jgi:hypothetical protein